MSIRIIYSNFKANADSGAIKELMARDASWGTHVEILEAAKSTCGQESHIRWQKTQPQITNLKAGRPEDDYFSLTFADSNFDLNTESIDHFVATVAGDIVLNPMIKNLEVRDFEFTDATPYESFPGPNVGVDGLYTDFLPTLNRISRPILAFTLKPRFGMTIHEISQLYQAAASAGIDIIEDDERLVDPPNCRFIDRVKILSKIQKDYQTVYSVNITSDSQSALEKLDYCAEHGIKMVKIDVLVCGFETLRKVANRIKDKYSSKIAITVYPDAYGAYRRLSREFILRLSRLCGADIIYAGSPNWARYESERGKFSDTIEPIYQRHRLLADRIEMAEQIKPTLGTITNDQHPSRAEMITVYFRKHKDGHHKYAFFVGGGISGFPADIATASKEWMSCLTYASQQDLDDYNSYDLSKYDTSLSKIGWDRLNVKEGLNA